MTTETNAERIQLIKETIGEMKERERKHNPLFYRDPAIMELYNDMDFLVEQAERARELEESIKGFAVAVEVYSEMPAEEAMKKLTDLFEEDGE